MLTETLILLFERDLKKLQAEIELYRNEEMIWSTEKNISNSAGNLALHLTGNLNYYIGSVIGKTGYVRNRELEFSLKNIPKNELINKIEDTINIVGNSLKKMTKEELEYDYPILIFSAKTSTEYFLVHLATHLTYHLGQINYHRRLLDE
ncbi:MAG: DUF1572 family protein [Balneolales bacterium]